MTRDQMDWDQHGAATESGMFGGMDDADEFDQRDWDQVAETFGIEVSDVRDPGGPDIMTIAEFFDAVKFGAFSSSTMVLATTALQPRSSHQGSVCGTSRPLPSSQCRVHTSHRSALTYTGTTSRRNSDLESILE